MEDARIYMLRAAVEHLVFSRVALGRAMIVGTYTQSITIIILLGVFVVPFTVKETFSALNNVVV